MCTTFHPFDLIVFEFFQPLDWHEPRGRLLGLGPFPPVLLGLRKESATGRLDVNQVAVGEHPLIGQQAFIDGTQLIDPQFRIVHSTDSASPLIDA